MNSPAMGAGASSNARNSEDEGVNMKEVDGLLNEIAVMLGRWALYVRFISGKCKVRKITSCLMSGCITNTNATPGSFGL